MSDISSSQSRSLMSGGRMRGRDSETHRRGGKAVFSRPRTVCQSQESWGLVRISRLLQNVFFKVGLSR